MSNHKDGGQAFPGAFTVGPNDDLYPAEPGMTLRDYFAAQALVGYCSVEATWNDVSPGELARTCYRTADAMLAERSK